MSLYALTFLIVSVCPLPVVEGIEPWCFKWKSSFYADQILCKRSIDLGLKNGNWEQAATARNLVPGTVIELKCPPYVRKFIVE